LSLELNDFSYLSTNNCLGAEMKRSAIASLTLASTLFMGTAVGSIAYAEGRRHRNPAQQTAAVRQSGRDSAAARGERDRGEGRIKNISFNKVVDLSHVIDPNIPLWPGDPAVQFNTVASLDVDGYYLRSFTIGEHSATHMNANNSFVGLGNGSGIDAYGPEKLVRRAVVIDVRPQVTANIAANGPIVGADYVITVNDIKAWERRNGRIPKDSVVMFLTGWQDKWNNPVEFINNVPVDGNYSVHFPGIGEAATNWMLSERGIAGVGIDTHGADPGQDSSYATNVAVLAQDGIVLECLTNLDKLKPTGNTIVMGRLALKDGSGSPLTVLAFAE
jgi:kynurenine formamidase